MSQIYRDVEISTAENVLHVAFTLENRPGVECIGYQFFDPESGRFIEEGRWTRIESGERVPINVKIPFPPETGGYQIYISPVSNNAGWAYRNGEPFLLLSVQVSDGSVSLLSSQITTRRALRLRSLRRAIPKALTYPLLIPLRHFRLIQSMVRRDILARYRGSVGDVVWTFLNPLLLMATYIFVFGVVLQARFGADRSSTGFALYFLAGMLPWLALSEAAGRAPHVILEHRNFVKKLIFPLEILPVNQVLAGLVTELFALVVFVIILIVLRGSVPLTFLWFPLLVVPQLLFTLGLCWFLAALGVFLRDLGQIMGFLLTLWFFLTPICYPETSLPPGALIILRKNPLYVLVGAYRAIFLEGHNPAALPMLKFCLLALATFLLGYAWFHKLRKMFADVI